MQVKLPKPRPVGIIPTKWQRKLFLLLQKLKEIVSLSLALGKVKPWSSMSLRTGSQCGAIELEPAKAVAKDTVTADYILTEFISKTKQETTKTNISKSSYESSNR